MKYEHSYVSRQNPRDENRHVILGTQWFKPRDFANQMNVNLANGWGIVRTIVDLCFAQQEGKYVLLKDPNKVRRSLCYVLRMDSDDGHSRSFDCTRCRSTRLMATRRKSLRSRRGRMMICRARKIRNGSSSAA